MVHNIVCLTYGALKLCVDASLGGHIVEFSVDQKNALATNRSAIGSTFWPSPQDAWGWPPLPKLDNQPYTVTKSDSELVLVSQICDKTGLQVQKQFRFTDGYMEAIYTMINTNERSVQYAPWEITRILGGITFYKGDAKPLANSTGTVTQRDSFTWHEYKPKQQKGNEKVFGVESAGWLANANDGLLLVKRFDKVSIKDAAPGESEIEIYGHGDPQNAYIEMEQQGPFVTINAKQSYQWRVEWHLQSLPTSVAIELGNPELPKAVETLLGL